MLSPEMVRWSVASEPEDERPGRRPLLAIIKRVEEVDHECLNGVARLQKKVSMGDNVTAHHGQGPTRIPGKPHPPHAGTTRSSLFLFSLRYSFVAGITRPLGQGDSGMIWFNQSLRPWGAAASP